ncbi:uncharacterized protein LOC144430677 [Styela clava]
MMDTITTMNTVEYKLNASTLKQTTMKDNEENWQVQLIMFEVISGCILLLSIWILLSLLIYGLKTNSWKSSGKSSLNSGIIFNACIIVVFAALVRFLYTTLIFQMPRIESWLNHCNLVSDVGICTYFASFYAIYLFLFLRQILILRHPAVKDLISKKVEIFSYIAFTIISITIFATFCFYVVSTKYQATPQGCIREASPLTNVYYGTISAFIISQILLTYLSGYTMIRTNLSWTKNTQKKECDIETTSQCPSGTTEATETKKTRLASLMRRMIVGNTDDKLEINPVARTIRHSVISCLIIVVTDIIATAIASLAIPTSTPRSISDTVSNISIFIDIICIVLTFKNGRQILTVFCNGLMNLCSTS